MTDTTFWDRHAPKYAAKPIADPDAYQAKLKRVREYLTDTDCIIEVGCGTGSTSLQLAPHVAEVVATDVSPGMIQIAKSKLVGAAPINVDFQVSDAVNRIAEKPFDVLLAFSLLHLVEDIQRTLQAIHDQLKPGGLFISKTVSLKDRPVFIRALVRVLSLIGVAPRVTPLSRDLIEQAIRQAGFELIETTYFDAAEMSPFIVARRVA